MTYSQQKSDARATDLLRRHVKLLFDQLPQAVVGQEEAIHELRIAARRLRVALSVLARRPGGKRQARCRSTLRTLVRTSGAARDLDVAAHLLDAHLAIADPGPRPADAVALRRHMRAARRRSRARLAQALLDAEIGRLRVDLDSLLAGDAPTTQTTLARIAELASRRRDAAARQIRELGMGADSEALHAIRRGVRRLRYLAELSAQLTGGSSDAPRLLKGLQDALGHVHDQHVLATWLTAHAGRARARGATGLGRASARLKTRVEQARRRLHQAYLNRRPLNIVSRAMTVSGIVLPEPLMLGRATMKAG